MGGDRQPAVGVREQVARAGLVGCGVGIGVVAQVQGAAAADSETREERGGLPAIGERFDALGLRRVPDVGVADWRGEVLRGGVLRGEML
ncbi:hypothetical protein, partial [Catenulispora pinisilvae]|uniref:hypothetical protein n=1 Tax=Catenulispora pinisilvae TaxID=2705253 RepID=UPI001E2CA12A